MRWQKWRLRVGFTPREGLVLHRSATRTGGGGARSSTGPRCRRWSCRTATPPPVHSRKNAFDAGEYSIGALANSLELGCDCLGEIRYFDAVMADSRRRAVHDQERRSACTRRTSGSSGSTSTCAPARTEVRRSRRLVVSFIATVGNYEYGFYWYFYQDGTIEYEVKLTGILSTGAVRARRDARRTASCSTPTALRARSTSTSSTSASTWRSTAPNNSVYEVTPRPRRRARRTRIGNAFYAKPTLLDARVRGAAARRPAAAARYWKVVNPSVTNAVGEPVGVQAGARAELPAVRPGRRPREQARRVHGEAPVGDAATTRRAARRRRLPEPAPGRRRAPRDGRRPTAPSRTPTGALVHVRRPPLARPEDWPVMPVHVRRLQAAAGRLLRPEPRAGRTAAGLERTLRPPPRRSRRLEKSQEVR